MTEINSSSVNSKSSLFPPLWTHAVLFSAAYFGLACLGYFLAQKPGPFINFWLPSGLFVAVLLRHDSRSWPIFILAAFPANILFDLWNGQRILVSFCFYAGNSLEALTGAWLIRRFVAVRPDLSNIKEIIGLVVFSAFLSSMLSAFIGSWTATKMIGAGTFGEIWFLWWSSDVLGIILLAPVILSWRGSFQWGSPDKPLKKSVETVLFMILLTVGGIFIMKEAWHYNVGMRYLFLPFLIWAAYRLGVRGTAVAALCVALWTTWFTIGGQTNFSRIGLSPRIQVMAQQLFLAVITLTGLFLAVSLKERRRSEEALRESEERFRIIASNTPDYLIVQDRDLRYSLVMNPQLGLTEKNMIGKTDYDFLSPKDAGNLTAIKRQVLETGKPIQVEVPLTNLKGEEEFFDGSYIPKFDKEGQVNGLVGYFRNVTERKKAEEKIRESERKFSEVLEKVRLVAIQLDSQGKIVFCNDYFLEMTGWKREELLGKNWFETCLPSSIKDKVMSLFLEGITSGNITPYYENEIVTQSRNLKLIAWNNMVLRNLHGSIVGTTGIGEDITERREAMKALGKSEEKFRNLFNNAQVGMFRTKIDGSEILDINEKFLEIFGWTREEMLASVSVILWADPKEREASVRRLMIEGRMTNFECRMRTKQGEVIHCLASVRIYPEEGILEGSIIDITERKRAEEQIKASLAEKEVLLKEIHHRVKNNLAIISSLIRLQARQISDSESKNIMEECDNRIQSMARVHSKLYQSRDLAGIDLKAYLQDLVKDLFKSYQVIQEKVEVNLQIADWKPDLQTTVPLGLILNELVSNAFKYAFLDGQKGLIAITLQREDGRIGLTVADNGVGFPEELDFRNTTSLGLQLVMALVKQLHGTIEMARNEGTVFTIRFEEEKVKG